MKRPVLNVLSCEIASLMETKYVFMYKYIYFYSLSNKILPTPIKLCLSLLTETLTVQLPSFDFDIC